MQPRRAGGEADRDEENALFVALLELHRRKQLKVQRDAGQSAYGRVLEHFEQRGKRLAGERLAMEQLLGGALRGAQALPPSVQQELVISGPLGSSAGGRFRVRNRLSRATRVELVAGDALDGVAPALRFEPQALELAPGAAALVRVVADLGPVRGAGRCTVPVQCRADGTCDRLWLVIESYDAHKEAP